MILTPIAASPDDGRDIPFVPSGAPLPAAVNMAQFVTQVENQEEQGACGAHAGTTAPEMIAKRAGIIEELSRQMANYLALLDENRLGQEGVVTLRSIVHAGYKYGFCLESEWPYSAEKKAVRPPDACFASASTRKITRYERIDIQWWSKPVDQIKAALAEGLPVIIAMTVNAQIYAMKGPLGQQKYEVAENGKRLPSEGAHAVVIVGYDDAIGGFIYANSWGAGWGDGGFGRLEYRHIGEVFEAWVVRGYRDIYIAPPVPVEPPKPAPVPVPVPAPVPAPEPDPVPPAPEPQPEPLPVPEPIPPQPEPEKKDGNGAVIAIAAIVGILLLAHFGGFFK